VKATIFIPTKNAGEHFDATLLAIKNQSEKDHEIIVVDSGSKDRTLDIARKHAVNLYQIPPSQFGHGKTRNLALQHGKGEFIVFLSQDVLPMNDAWLGELLKAFQDEKVAGAFSRQIPRENAPATEIFFHEKHFPPVSRVNLPSQHPLPSEHFFSDASSAVRRSIFAVHPFKAEIMMTEDQEWTKRMLRMGYKTAYQADSVVMHSHRYSFIQTLRRYFDSAYCLKEINNGEFHNFTKEGSFYTFKELFYTLKTKPLELPRTLMHILAKVIGTTLGMHAEKLPLSMKRAFSMHSYYWTKDD